MTHPPAPHKPNSFDRRWRRLTWWQRAPVVTVAAVVGLAFSMVVLGFIVGPQEDDDAGTASRQPTRQAADDEQGSEALASETEDQPAGSEEENESDRPEPEPEPTPEGPSYRIVEQSEEGNQREVIAEVETTDGLAEIFDDIVSGLSDEAGYFVMINCSTGGTDSVDNRLANGRHAIGRMGEATTGLADGESDFSTNDGRSCPAE